MDHAAHVLLDGGLLLRLMQKHHLRPTPSGIVVHDSLAVTHVEGHDLQSGHKGPVPKVGLRVFIHDLKAVTGLFLNGLYEVQACGLWEWVPLTPGDRVVVKRVKDRPETTFVVASQRTHTRTGKVILSFKLYVPPPPPPPPDGWNEDPWVD